MGQITLKSWTPMTANMNCRRYVTSMIFPMVFIATITHLTTYYKQGKKHPGKNGKI